MNNLEEEFKSRIFTSQADFDEYASQFLRATHTVTTKRSSKTNKDLATRHLFPYKDIRYTCVNFGSYKAKIVDGSRPGTHTGRIDCKYQFAVQLVPASEESATHLRVSKDHLFHNHVVSKATFDNHPKNRRLTAEEVKYCEEMFQAKLKFRDVHRLAEEKFSKTIAIQDLRNLFYNLRSKAREDKTESQLSEELTDESENRSTAPSRFEGTDDDDKADQLADCFNKNLHSKELRDLWALYLRKGAQTFAATTLNSLESNNDFIKDRFTTDNHLTEAVEEIVLFTEESHLDFARRDCDNIKKRKSDQPYFDVNDKLDEFDRTAASKKCCLGLSSYNFAPSSEPREFVESKQTPQTKTTRVELSYGNADSCRTNQDKTQKLAQVSKQSWARHNYEQKEATVLKKKVKI